MLRERSSRPAGTRRFPAGPSGLSQDTLKLLSIMSEGTAVIQVVQVFSIPCTTTTTGVSENNDHLHSMAAWWNDCLTV